MFPSRGKLAEERKAEEAMGELGWKGREEEEGQGDGVWWIKQTVSLGGFGASLAYGIFWYRIRYMISSCELETISDLLNLPPILLSPYRQLTHAVSYSISRLDLHLIYSRTLIKTPSTLPLAPFLISHFS